MIRLLGGALIMAACAVAGYRGAGRLAEQRRRYCGWQQGLSALQRAIEYHLIPLPRALREAAEAAGAGAEVFSLSARLLAEGDGLSGGEAWSLALDGANLKQQEREILALVAAGLGLSDAESQSRQLEACAGRLHEAEQEATEKEKRFGKLWRSMGWAAGATLILLLA